MRAISPVVALVAFYSRPRTPGIMAGTSLTGFLLSPWYVWDVYYYVEIVRNGYQPGAATPNFHPLYPWIATLVAVVIREPLSSLLLVSSVAGLVLTVCFYRLAKLDGDEQQAWQATALLLVWPASMALFVPYTESLFLLLSVYCLFAARHKKFWLAGLAGGLASLTRQQGLFLIFPLAWEIWESSERRWSNALRKALSLLLVAAGYAVWIVYRAVAINDLHPDFSSLQKFIHSVMVSPASYAIIDDHEFLPPWAALWKAFNVFWRGEAAAGAYLDVVLGAVFLSLFVLSWRYLRTSYRVYCVVIVLVSLSFFTGHVNPFIALPRHLLLAFPVFIGLAARYRLRKFPLLPLLMVMMAVCQMALLCTFVWQTWVP
ncbi:MAG TPA: glycosyltransferase family 39 protein [Pyrinomonadaceae bacterium]|nr:glycosyltransferase family 39 protein [Pyrinomonadaceae bacterium]